MLVGVLSSLCDDQKSWIHPLLLKFSGRQNNVIKSLLLNYASLISSKSTLWICWAMFWLRVHPLRTWPRIWLKFLVIMIFAKSIIGASISYNAYKNRLLSGIKTGRRDSLTDHLLSSWFVLLNCFSYEILTLFGLLHLVMKQITVRIQTRIRLHFLVPVGVLHRNSFPLREFFLCMWLACLFVPSVLMEILILFRDLY